MGYHCSRNSRRPPTAAKQREPSQERILLSMGNDTPSSVSDQIHEHYLALLIDGQTHKQASKSASILGSSLIGNWGDAVDVYWTCEYVSAASIATAIHQTLQEFSRNVDPMLTDIPCFKCGEPIWARNRTDLADLQRKHNNLCKYENNPRGVDAYRVPLCARHNDAHGTFKFTSAAKRHIERLASMPYRDYLKTPEWQSVRRKALAVSGHKCFLCYSPHHLDVHHKTYARRGHERLEDVVVLCRTCHSRHHGFVEGR